MNDFSGSVTAEMPKYQCHKQVWALKISSIEFGLDPDAMVGDTSPEILRLVFENGLYAPIRITPDYFNKHQPKVGGYYVKHSDGYESYSPANVFEDGYTKAS